jgi:hypothetical protein
LLGVECLATWTPTLGLPPVRTGEMLLARLRLSIEPMSGTLAAA